MMPEDIGNGSYTLQMPFVEDGRGGIHIVEDDAVDAQFPVQPAVSVNSFNG